jgi:hypothetical protein
MSASEKAVSGTKLAIPVPPGKALVEHYDDVRDEIFDGDVCLFREGSFHDRLIEIGSGSPYCHCALAFWEKDFKGTTRAYLVQATAAHGVAIELLSDVIREFDGPVELWRVSKQHCPEYEPKIAIRTALSAVGRPYAMDHVYRFILDMLTYGIFDLRPHGRGTKSFVCSQLVAWACRRAKARLDPAHSPAASLPSDLVAHGRIVRQRVFAHGDFVDRLTPPDEEARAAG